MLDRGMSMMYANMSATPETDKWLSVFGEMSVLNKHDDLKVYKHYKDIQETMGHVQGRSYMSSKILKVQEVLKKKYLL